MGEAGWSTAQPLTRPPGGAALRKSLRPEGCKSIHVGVIELNQYHY